jgi:hypothetical protein
MAAEPRTVAEAGTISSREVVAAIDAYMLNPAAGPYRFISGHSLDLAALVNASPALRCWIDPNRLRLRSG